MFRILISKLWPTIFPIAVFLLWRYIKKHRVSSNIIQDSTIQDNTKNAIFFMIVSSLVIAIISFIMMGVSLHSESGKYIPPHIKNGKLIDGEIVKNITNPKN